MDTSKSFSPEETERYGQAWAQRAQEEDVGSGAYVLVLTGDLGTGKTTFTRGFLHGLGVRGKVVSPTFPIMRRFGIETGKFRNAYHVDAYRLKDEHDLLALGFGDILGQDDAVVVVEWGERVGRCMPGSARLIRFSHGGGNTRIVEEQDL